MNIEILKKYEDDGLIKSQSHPFLPLLVWNYTPRVQYEKLWDSVTSSCRGLITNSNGDVVAHCLSKFHNMEELNPNDIPNEPFVITEKMDGSYISMFNYMDIWVFASRGSFTSDQAILAERIFEKKYKNKVVRYPGHTFIMELIGPSNRIVLNYPEDDLVLLTVIEPHYGTEINIHTDTMLQEYNKVKYYDGINDFTKIKSMITDNQEGYVVRFKNGFRMKIKGDEYVRLHHILTNISNRDIWRYLKDGEPLDEILEKVPDEFYFWVKETEKSLLSMFESTKDLAEMIFYKNISENMTRKEVAEYVLTLPQTLRSLMFMLYDKKDISTKIWDRIYPSYEKPFKKMDDEKI